MKVASLSVFQDAFTQQRISGITTAIFAEAVARSGAAVEGGCRTSPRRVVSQSPKGFHMSSRGRSPRDAEDILHEPRQGFNPLEYMLQHVLDG